MQNCNTVFDITVECTFICVYLQHAQPAATTTMYEKKTTNS